jgi:hypothetical protein
LMKGFQLERRCIYLGSYLSVFIRSFFHFDCHAGHLNYLLVYGLGIDSCITCA